jgi:tetratricopeptide (TPR) repeat protein
MVALLAALSSAGAVLVQAQEHEDIDIDEVLIEAMRASEGEDATRDELLAFSYAERGRFIKARELATEIVREHPRSFVGHYVLGFAEHYGEANFPRALFHYENALRLYEARHGRAPEPPAPWRWHSRILRELAFAHGDLEHHAEKVLFLDRHNELYDPDMLADKSWPLMKMGLFDEARLAAREGLQEGSPRQVEVALNALCAVEFEAGNDGASYEACREALEFGRTQPGGANAVDLTNYSEAARSLFKLDEAERIGIEATEADVAWYGSPWIELAELYTREARFAEALHALREVPRYRQRRPAHVRDVDRNEGRRALSAFFLVVGRPDDALRITEKALVAPDRRAHNSRDPNQDLAIAALLDRRARLIAREKLLEEAAARPFWENPPRWAEASWLGVEAWMSGRQAARLMADDDRLVGTFRIGTSKGAIMQPWLAGELVEVLGAGVVREAVRRARDEDERPGADAYYDAFDAEAALASGDDEDADDLGARALEGLEPGEALLRARTSAIRAEALRRRGELGDALGAYEEAFAADPGVFRRLGLVVPVKVEVSGGDVAEDVASALDWSPRFDVSDDGLVVRIESDGTRGEVCLVGASGGVLGCAELDRESQEEADDFATRLSNAFHQAAFAPVIDLSQADANSLDGANRTTRDPLEGLWGTDESSFEE